MTDLWPDSEALRDESDDATADGGIVSLRWRGTQLEGVRIDNNWKRGANGEQLLEAVKTEFQKVRGVIGPTWRSQVGLRGMRLDRMEEFVEAIRAARAEDPPADPEETSTRHLRATWQRGRLAHLRADMMWIESAPLQSLGDEFMEVLSSVPEKKQGPAVTRLLRIMEEAR